MHYYQFNMQWNQFNKLYIRFPKLPAQSCKPNHLPWRINVPADKDYNCICRVSHSLPTEVLIIRPELAVGSLTVLTRSIYQRLTRVGKWQTKLSSKIRNLDGYVPHIYWTACFCKTQGKLEDLHFARSVRFSNKHQFSLKIGAALLNYPKNICEMSETSYTS